MAKHSIFCGKTQSGKGRLIAREYIARIKGRILGPSPQTPDYRYRLSVAPGYDFYVAFNFFRLAAIFHGIKGRVIRGTASSAQATERVAVLPELMDIAWQQALRAGASG